MVRMIYCAAGGPNGGLGHRELHSRNIACRAGVGQNQVYYTRELRRDDPQGRHILSPDCCRKREPGWCARWISAPAPSESRDPPRSLRSQGPAFFTHGVGPHLGRSPSRGGGAAIPMHESTVVAGETATSFTWATIAASFELKVFFTASDCVADGG